MIPSYIWFYLTVHVFVIPPLSQHRATPRSLDLEGNTTVVYPLEDGELKNDFQQKQEPVNHTEYQQPAKSDEDEVEDGQTGKDKLSLEELLDFRTVANDDCIVNCDCPNGQTLNVDNVCVSNIVDDYYYYEN